MCRDKSAGESQHVPLFSARRTCIREMEQLSTAFNRFSISGFSNSRSKRNRNHLIMSRAWISNCRYLNIQILGWNQEARRWKIFNIDYVSRYNFHYFSNWNEGLRILNLCIRAQYHSISDFVDIIPILDYIAKDISIITTIELNLKIFSKEG